MIKDYENVPCVVRYKGVIFKTNKTSSFFTKHREMNVEDTEIFYIDSCIKERSEIDRALTILERSLQGKETNVKKQEIDQRPYTHTYRVNANTVLCAYNQEDLDKLKENWNIL